MCFFTSQSGHSSGCSKLGCWWLTSAYSPSGEQFNPLISMDLQVHFYPCSTHSCPCPVPAHAPHRPAGEWSSLVCGDRLQPHPAWQTVGALSPRSKFNHFHFPDVQMSCIHRPKKAQADVWSANTRVRPRKQYNTTVVFQVLPPSGAAKIELNDGLFEMYLFCVLSDRLRKPNPFCKLNGLMSCYQLLFFFF